MYLSLAKHKNRLKKMFSTPFNKISKRTERKLTFSIASLFFIASIVMLYLNKPLKNDIAPNGIISFEFANTLERSQEILASWTPLTKIFVGIGLGFDFLYAVIYSLFIAIIIHKINTYLWSKKPFYRYGNLLIWSLLAAALLDTLENICLIKLLIGNTKQHWASMAYYFASTKFLLIALAILYSVANSILILSKKRS